jgi:integrase
MAGTVRKRTWQTRKGVKAAWIVDYYDQNRKRRQRTFATMGAAESWLTDTRTEIKAGVHTPDAGSITVKEAAAIWLAQCESDELERGTVRIYGQYVRLYIVELLGSRKLSRLTTPIVVAFRDVVLKQSSRQRTRKVLSALKLLLAEMQRRGLVAQNVAQPVSVKLSDRVERRPMIGTDVPSKNEMQAMLRCAQGRERVRFITFALTGVRASELRALCWSELDFERRILTVRQRADWWGTIGPVKTKNGYRDIPMSPLLVNTLKEWRLACPRRNTLPDLVFPGRDHRVPSHTTVQSDFDRIQLAAGVVDTAGKPKYSLHALRHFFASWGIEQGFHAKRLQELLGHGSIQMTYDVYGHWLGDLADDHARFAAGEAALFGPTPTLGGPRLVT